MSKFVELNVVRNDYGIEGPVVLNTDLIVCVQKVPSGYVRVNLDQWSEVGRHLPFPRCFFVTNQYEDLRHQLTGEDKHEDRNSEEPNE